MSADLRRLSAALALAAALSATASAQKTFASPKEAVAALRAAVSVHDKAALQDIFGPQIRELLTGDEAQDKANSRRFAQAIDEGAKPVAEGDDKVYLEIGANRWTFPIPLVKTGSDWRFDTAAGKQEIVDRHVGKDELQAIGACEAYVRAQKAYAASGRASGAYALRFTSAPGKKDGLYWKTWPIFAPSLLAARVAAAGVEGDGPAAHPYHGYFFRILTRQGAGAPGGAFDYVKDGRLTGGFALAAYPDRWGRSGIMTFIVDQDGKVYQRDLGEKTVETVSAMSEYDPGADWTPVKDKGLAVQ